MKKNIATVISRLFDPFIVLSVVFVLTFIRGGVTHIFTWILAFALLVGVPVALIVFAMRKKIVSNWDVSDRRQRPNVLGVLVALEAVNLLILRLMVSPEVTRTLFFILVVLVGFTGITLYWKISGHALAAALTTGMILRWYGWGAWPVLLIVPLVAWSRVVRKDHTMWQVIAGAAYAWILIYFFT
jgi:membrane-associated phospholipid phosphatase